MALKAFEKIKGLTGAVVTTIAGTFASASRNGIKPIAIVLHADAGRYQGTVDTLRKKGYSYHYYIRKNGTIVKFVPLSRSAQANGTTIPYNGISISNSNSISIAFENLNDSNDPYTNEQRIAVKKLLGDIVKGTPSVRYLTTHRDISYPRKTDPEKFDGVDRLAELYGLEYWTRPGVPNI